MDERRNLILIKGENKTWQIKRCYYDPQSQRYQVTFDNNKTYAYPGLVSNIQKPLG